MLKFLSFFKSGRSRQIEWLTNLQNLPGVGLCDLVLYNSDPLHPKTQCVYSDGMRHLLGFSSESDFPNVPESWADRLHPDDAEQVLKDYDAALATGRSFETPYRLQVKDGSYRWFRDSVHVMMDHKGRPRHFSVATIDIHEMRMLQEEQRLAMEQLGMAMRHLAQGNLCIRLDDSFPERLAALKADFNTAMVSLHDVISGVSASSGGITHSANAIDQATADLSQRTQQQAVSLEKTAATMGQIHTMVRQTAETAARVNKVVLDAMSEAQQGGEVVHETIEAMHGIEVASSEISQIISVIDGIAFQTNLLALNAGVEAARAGDAGRGFAVVASEVRALAQRSADAATDVKTRILASAAQVAAGVSRVDRTGEALERIIARVDEISQLTKTIASAAEHEAAELQGVNNAVHHMDEMTQQNAAMVEEMTAASASLASEAGDLTENVKRFTLAEQGGSRAGNPVHQLRARLRA